MILLVCGSRTYNNRRVMEQVITKLEPEKIIHGGCHGADELAHCIADTYGIYVEVFEANWTRYGKSAGPIRNREMLKHGRPDLVLAFFDGNRTKGTMNMVKLATERHVPVLEYGLRHDK
jgi:hypothetical protein